MFLAKLLPRKQKLIWLLKSIKNKTASHNRIQQRRQREKAKLRATNVTKDSSTDCHAFQAFDFDGEDHDCVVIANNAEEMQKDAS